MTDASQNLVARLRTRKAFLRNGASWVMRHEEPDGDCREAANLRRR